MISTRRIARRLLTALVLVLVLAAAGVGGAGAWLLYTESGLRWLTTRVAGFAGEGLSLDGVAGSLAGGARVKNIRYAGADIEIRVVDAYLTLAPFSLLRLRPHISGMQAAEIAVVTKPGEPRGKPPDTLALPLGFELTDAYVQHLKIDMGKEPIELTDVRLDFTGGLTKHRLRDLSLNAFGHAIAVQGEIGVDAPFPLTASMSAVSRQAPGAVVYAAAKGNLTQIALEGGARSAGARATATAKLRPYDELPLVSIAAQSTGLDLSAFVSGLPRTAIDSDLALERSKELYTGHVRLTNAAAGTYDQGRLPLTALRAEVRTDGETARLSALVADFGKAGTVTGSGEFDRERAKLALTTRKLDLAGLHGRLNQTHLGGRADIALTQARQSVTAELAQDDMALKITAHREGDEIEVPAFVARARGGEARGEARMKLSAGNPFSAKASLSRFDPAAWGSFPAGSINGTLSAEGAMKGPEVFAKFSIRDSRWLNASLSARGEIALAGERLRNADIDATLGGNSLVAKGALGAAKDTLTVRFNAPRLAIVDPSLQGVARGNVQLTGSWRTPGVRFDITGTNLAHQAYGRIKALDARGTLSAQADGAFDVDATLREVSTPQITLSSASANLKGTRNAHTALVNARGDRIDFQARAAGGWRQGSGWSGTLQELINRGDAEVRLMAPVSITAGPQLVRTQPFELRVIGGTVAVKQLVYEKGKLSTAGRFYNLPVRPMLALARAPAEMAGTLRLTGNWSLTNQPTLAGSISISRESGDVALGADKSLRVGLQTLSIDTDIGASGATFRARVRSALANASADGRVTALNGDYSGASPLVFAAEVDVARLEPFAGLIDTTVLIAGEAHAKLQGRGTLSDPQITGQMTADRLAVALPAEGIDLRGGTLRAQLTERQIRVDSFSIRGGEGVLNAEGTLARAGFNEASVDWRAERFMVLTRPDRRLALSGKGNASLRAGKLALTGNLRATEGLFEIGTVKLPTLGDDVVIVGRESQRAPPSEAGKLPRTSVDVAIDLGNNVHVRGSGLDVWLVGNVRVQTNSQGEIRATGTVDAQRGTFAAYGQRLDIDRGRFYFNGPPSNPGLDILAMRKRQAVEAGVAVTGTLNRPLVRVVSDPPLPEGEALSWLVLGQGPGTASAGQLSALPLAAGALMGKVGDPLAKTLRLDEVGLRGSSNVSEQFLTVGKRITDRIYVVFEQSLGGAENLLRLEMTLTKRIALRAQAGQTSSVGVFYRFGWD